MRQFKFLSFVVLSVAACSLLAFAQDAKTQKEAKEVEEKEPAKRLPPYYKDVVTETQRAEIYKLQEQYNNKISVLAEEIKKLQAERSTAIEALLTPEQKKKLADIKAAAAAKAKEGKEPKETTTETAKPKEGATLVPAVPPVVPSVVPPVVPSVVPSPAPVAPPATPKKK